MGTKATETSQLTLGDHEAMCTTGMQSLDSDEVELKALRDDVSLLKRDLVVLFKALDDDAKGRITHVADDGWSDNLKSKRGPQWHTGLEYLCHKCGTARHARQREDAKGTE